MRALAFRKFAEEAAKIYDGQEAALDDVKENRGDNQSYLRGLFDNAGAFETNVNKEMKKLLPGGGNKEGGNVFLKLARLEHTPFFKEASSAYQQVVFLGFQHEMEKIAAPLPGKTLGQIGREQSVRNQFGKTWRVAEPSAAQAAPGLVQPSRGLAPGVQAMRSKPWYQFW